MIADFVHLTQTAARQRWLIIELVARELKLRYRGSVFGLLWTLLNPLVFMGIYTLVFSSFLRINIPQYPVFLITGLLPWLWFTESVPLGANCVIDHAGFLRNAVFPSSILPFVSVATGMMNFIFSLPILLFFLQVFNVEFRMSLVALPLVMMVHFIFTLAIVLVAVTCNVFFRDVRYLINHALLALFFVSPVMYNLSIVPQRFHWILKLNPLTTLLDSYRSIFFYGTWPHWRNFGFLAALAVLMLILGAWIYERYEEIFAEYI